MPTATTLFGIGAIAAIVIGVVMVFADERIGKFGPRGPEAGAAMMRGLALILLVGGGLALLSWTN
jgi:hypothetical protein